MMMEKYFKGMKQHSYEERVGYTHENNFVSGYFSQNQLANSVDTLETFCRYNQGSHIPMSSL